MDTKALNAIPPTTKNKTKQKTRKEKENARYQKQIH